MRRSGFFVVLAVATVVGCKSGVILGNGGTLDIYTDPTALPITNATFQFPEACQGAPVTQKFYIANTSQAAVTVSSVTLSNTTAFSLVPPVVAANTDVEPTTDPSQTTTVQTVQFSPTSSGPQPSSTLTVATANGGAADGGAVSYTVTLSGNGSNGSPVAQLSTTCAAGSPCGYMIFPQTAVGSPSTLPLTVANTGCAPMTLAVSFIDGPDGGVSPFSLQNPAPGSINLGNPANLVVVYAPTKGGGDIWKMLLTTNDSSNPMYTINLTGTSTTPFVDISSPQCGPSGIPIGNNGQVNVGSTFTVPYTVTNNGGLDVELGIPFIEDGSSAGFAVSGAWSAPIPLDGGDSAMFDVTFTSPGAGNFQGTVDIPVVGGAVASCRMITRSQGQFCSPDGGSPQQMLVLPGPADPQNQLCYSTEGSVTLTNCGSAPIDMCGIDAGSGNNYYGIDAGAFGPLDPGASFTFTASFTDPATLVNPWNWTFNICNDAPGYGLDDAGGGGLQLTVQATANLIPQPLSIPPVVISGLNDAGSNPYLGSEMHLIADIDGGLGAYYDFVWTAPPVASTEINVCGDGGAGLWYIDGGPSTLPDGGPAFNTGGEAFVTPTKYWVIGDQHPIVCKICVFAYEKDAGGGNCQFNSGFVPNASHCYGGNTGVGVVTGP